MFTIMKHKEKNAQRNAISATAKRESPQEAQPA